jgi:hypothetical protein
MWSGYLADPDFVAIAQRDLAEGQHRNPTGKPAYFTTAYFHHPDELQAEVEDAGLVHQGTLSIEGVAVLLPDFDAWWYNEAWRERILEAVRWLEAEPSVLGAGGHLMVVGRKA